MKSKIFGVMVVLLAGTSICQAGWLDSTLGEIGKKIKGRVTNDVNTTTNDASNSAYDALKGGVYDAVKGSPQTPAQTPSMPGQQEMGQQVSGGAIPIEVETVFSKYDFIPGDKMIFFDDFSDTDVGEFPRKWTLQGPKVGSNNTVDVVEFQGKRFLRSVPGAKNQAPATQYIRLDQKGDFPEKFTIEFDAVFSSINNSPVYFIGYKVLLVPTDKKIDIFKRNSPNALLISGQDNMSANTTTKVQLNDGMVHHVAISVNGTFVKAYIDNQRVINDPDGIKRPIKQIGLQMFTPNNFKSDKLLFTNFRLADGGKDIKSALDTDGKIVTHGILFDTGMATLKAESLPTLKMILGLLNDDTNLKFSIEGHTDSQGNNEINQPLSEHRAAAVKTWLEGKGIDPSRLTTAGLGDSRPIDSNKTLEGRANNRRVEFVKF